MTDDQGLISGFLRGEESPVRAVEDWVQAAARPFRGRLGFSWDDCVQDCMLVVTRVLREERFRGGSTLRTYVWRLTVNACIDRLRARRIPAREVLEERQIPAPDPSPLAEIESREFCELAGKVFEEASVECRRLWAMILDGLSYQEMGESTGVRPGTLRVRVLRCRRQAWTIRERLLGAEGS